MSDTAVVAEAHVNPAQSPPPAPNSERAPAADDKALTPEQIAAAKAEADKGKTPEQIAAEAAAAKALEANPTITDDANEADKIEAPTSADADENGVITYPTTGDPGMDIALEFVGKLGIGMDDPAMQATLNGDFSLIRAKLAAMGDKATGHERMVDLAEAANNRAMEKATTAAKAINTAVAGVLGESQKDVLAWASKNATPAEKASINAMLRADPVQARAAAVMLANAYQAKSGNVITPASVTNDAGSSVPGQSNTRISRVEFARETNKLHRLHGNAYRNTAEYAALSRRLG